MKKWVKYRVDLEKGHNQKWAELFLDGRNVCKIIYHTWVGWRGDDFKCPDLNWPSEKIKAHDKVVSASRHITIKILFTGLPIRQIELKENNHDNVFADTEGYYPKEILQDISLMKNKAEVILNKWFEKMASLTQ